MPTIVYPQYYLQGWIREPCRWHRQAEEDERAVGKEQQQQEEAGAAEPPPVELSTESGEEHTK
jgi:hypothetical protein